MLPNESLLQVLQFTDAETLVLAKLTGRVFLRLVTKYAKELARGRRFLVDFYVTCIEYVDATVGARGRIECELDNQAMLAAACAELAEVIGPNYVSVLTFYGNTWNMLGIFVIFEAAPALKYAEEVALHSPFGSDIRDDSDAFMSNFGVMKSLHLWLSYGVFCDFSWAFLRQESSRGIRRIRVYAVASAWPKHGTNRAVKTLVRDCATLPRLLAGGTLELDFTGVSFSYSFSLHIIELLENSERELTFRMQTRRDDSVFTLNESDYTVDIDDGTTRYTSLRSGIVVEVNGRSVTVQSTVEKQTRRKNEELSPVVPLVE